jgi:hypothetical protein
MQKMAQKILLIYVLLQKSQFAIILCVGHSVLLYYNPKILFGKSIDGVA